MKFEDIAIVQRESYDVIAFNRIYAEITGSIHAALMLSQIFYWHTPARTGESRMKLEREGHKWIAKTRREWMDELYMSVHHVRESLNLLERMGLIERRYWRWNGERQTHIRIRKNRFVELYELAIENRRESRETADRRAGRLLTEEQGDC